MGSDTGRLLEASHTRAVPSSEHVSIHLPFGLKLAEDTTRSCSMGRPTLSPDVASQITAERSAEAVTIRLPAGLNSAVQTAPLCRRGSRNSGWPVSTDHNRAVASW